MSITKPPPWYVSGEKMPDPYDIEARINSLGIEDKKMRKRMIEEAYERRENRKWYQDYNGSFPSMRAILAIFLVIGAIYALLTS